LYSSPHPLPPQRTLLALFNYRQGKKTQSAKKRTRKKNIDRKEENENENERERRRREQRKGKERKGAAAAKLWRQQRWCRRANPRD